MRIGHFIHHLNPFGTERVLAALLKYRSPPFADQFVVSCNEGPMRAVFERWGAPVWITRDQREMSRRLRRADLVNLHVLHPRTIPPCLAGRFPRRKVITIQWPVAFPAAMADYFIASSVSAYELQPDRRRCGLIPNGIDLEQYPGHRIPTPGRRAICRACRPVKCDEFFWYALLPVLADYPDTELWLAGSDGPPSERVRTLGVLPDIVDLLASSYLYAYTPSPGSGTKDLAVMEAMAMGLPCVFSDVPVVRESVQDERAAALVPFQDAEATEAALRRLLDDPEGAAALGQRAREYALAHFDVRPQVAAYESAYRRVVQ
jgi:glycosyltransferase involved in cell wall biosynthesis